MSNVAKGFGSGDTVFVYYDKSPSLQLLPQSRVVADVRIIDGTNNAQVNFTNGDSIIDGPSSAQRVFTTQALCAAAIITNVIALYTPCVVFDTTLSGASTASNPATTLVRKG